MSKDWLRVAVAFLTAAGFHLSTSAGENRDVQIVAKPQARYPTLASWFGIEGYCDVRFSVDETGFPFAINPSCSRRVFCFDAKRAVSEARFKPKLEDGMPVERHNLVFPFTYSFEDSDYDSVLDPSPAQPCDEIPVA